MISKFDLKWYLRIFLTLMFLIILVGGVTRLTRSGLSITEWNVVSGILPPLTESAWSESFELYKKSPESILLNSHFDIGAYKKIFFWEWLHRFIARFIFLWAAIGGMILLIQKRISVNLALTLPLLVLSQGVIGWLMVRSGLQKEPHVSPYMLSIHFIFALIVAGYAHFYLSQLRPALPVRFKKLDWRLFQGLGVLLLLQVFYGCLVGGLKAGFMYNTYPFMDGQFLPAGAFYMPQYWMNFFENPIVVQWIHRWLGVVLLTYLMLITPRLLRKGVDQNLHLPIYHFLGIIFTQIILGVIVLLLKVEISFAALHQLCGAMIVITYLGIYFRIKRGGLA